MGATSGPILAEFERNVCDSPDRVALVSPTEGLSLTFGALRDRIAALVRQLDVDASCPVALATGNTVSFIELFLALRTLDVAVVSLDAALGDTAKIETCRSLGIATLLDSRGDRPWTLTRIDVDEPTIPPRTAALVKLTSGQTGAPRGVCFDEAALVAGISQIAEGMEITSRDRVLVAIPLSHSYGFDNGVLSLAVIGTPLVLQDDVLPRPLLATMRDAEISFFPAVPPLVRSLARTEWPRDLSLRSTICAAGPLTDEDASAYLEASRSPVHQFYGCTESGGITFERDPTSPDARGCVGTPLPGVRIEVEEDGRVAVHSAANFLAPFARGATATTNVVYPGDTAEWTATGRLRLTGRTVDFLKVGGKKVHARDLEALLLELPGVTEVAVVARADDVRGESPLAFLVTRAGSIDQSKLPRPFSSRNIRLVDELPYTSRGKLDRAALRRLT